MRRNHAEYRLAPLWAVALAYVAIARAEIAEEFDREMARQTLVTKFAEPERIDLTGLDEADDADGEPPIRALSRRDDLWLMVILGLILGMVASAVGMTIWP